MRTLTTMILLLATFFISCKESKKAGSSSNNANAQTMKANLIDGNWEANYIMNTPKAFDELYAGAKPSITFNSVTGKVNGMSGCNNFNGTFSLDDNKLTFGENMALTRKMCPDMAGETTFMETLKKVNRYSVTEQGKTLNLIMGDMAVMRLTRK